MGAMLDRALLLNPGFARGWYVSGVLRMWAGDVDSAIERVERSLTLSPRARVGNQLAVLGLAYLAKRQFDKAAEILQMAIQEAPGEPTAYRFLAACYARIWGVSPRRERSSTGSGRLLRL